MGKASGSGGRGGGGGGTEREVSTKDYSGTIKKTGTVSDGGNKYSVYTAKITRGPSAVVGGTGGGFTTRFAVNNKTGSVFGVREDDDGNVTGVWHEKSYDSPVAEFYRASTGKK